MSEGNDGPCYDTTASGTRPQRAMQEDTRQSDLVSLESKTGSTINTSRNLKLRFRSILAKLKNVETCDDENKEAPEPSPGNRLGGVENGVRKIDDEIDEMNAIAATLEDILG